MSRKPSKPEGVVLRTYAPAEVKPPRYLIERWDGKRWEYFHETNHWERACNFAKSTASVYRTETRIIDREVTHQEEEL